MRAYYLETSVWGMLVRGQPRGLRQDTQRVLRMLGARQATTIISQTVLEELEQAGPSDRRTMLEVIKKFGPELVAIDEPIVALADRYVSAGIVPAKKRNDALHVASATLAGADVLLSWNYRHLVRPRKAEEFCAVNLLCGYNAELEISSPAELLYGE